MKSATAILAIAALFLTAACDPVPEFTASLSDPGDTGFDARVLGHWYQLVKEDGVLHVSVTDAAAVAGASIESGKQLQVGLIFQDAKNEGTLRLPFSGFASRVDGELFYNLSHAKAWYSWDVTVPDEPAGHYIAQVFHPAPDTMLVCLLTSFTEADQVASGLVARGFELPILLNGRPIENGDMWEHRMVDGSREDLRRFALNGKAGNFYAAFYLRRLGRAWVAPDEDPEQWARIERIESECNLEQLDKF